MSILKTVRGAIIRELRYHIGNERPLKDYSDIFITWGITGGVGVVLYYLVFIMQGVGWISGLFGFFLVGLMTASFGMLMYYYFASWKDTVSKYYQSGMWAGIFILCMGYYLMCAISPDEQVTFAMLVVFQIITAPTFVGPFFVPLMLGEFAPGRDSGLCLIFYPAFALAFLAYRCCSSQGSQIIADEIKRNNEICERLHQETLLHLQRERELKRDLQRVKSKVNVIRTDEKNNSQRH